MKQYPALVIAILVVAFSTVDARATQESTSSSLDGLQERVLDHWTRLANGDRRGASEFIRNSVEQDEFRSAAIPPFSNPKIVEFDLSDYPARVIVGVEIDLLEFDWRVNGDWVAEDGSWYLEPGDRDELDIYSAAPPRANANEEFIAAFEQGFSVEIEELVIPEDAFGQVIEGEIPYSFDGAGLVRLRRVSGPSQVSVNVEDLRNIRSGGGVIRYRVIGTRLFDNELPDLVIQTRMGDLTSNVSIPVVWNGTPAYRYRYVTESIQPGYEGEIVLEIDNLSDETWNVGHTEFLNRRLRIVQAPPDPVEPGETARFVLATTVAFDNSPGSLIVNLSARNITIPYPQTDSDQ